MRIEVTEDDVVVRLSALDRASALRGDLRIPRASVVSADAVAHPATPLLRLSVGLRAPGWRYRCTSLDGARFWALDRGRPALRIRMDGGAGRLREATVSVRDLGQAEALARELRGGRAAPGGW